MLLKCEFSSFLWMLISLYTQYDVTMLCFFMPKPVNIYI
uniref:Uncharacterized protein n=1 Tax=Anguilla anguilla TaxID=7936 RepID=A0A0E9QHL1_ANGAN